MINNETLQELRDSFNLFDQKHSGEIDSSEMKAAMRAYGIQIDKKGMTEILHKFNRNYKDPIDFPLFSNILLPRIVIDINLRKINNLTECLKFSMKKNKVNQRLKQLKKCVNKQVIINYQDMKISDSELYDILNNADIDNDGFIDINDFQRIMKKQGVYNDDSD